MGAKKIACWNCGQVGYEKYIITRHNNYCTHVDPEQKVRIKSVPCTGIVKLILVDNYGDEVEVVREISYKQANQRKVAMKKIMEGVGKNKKAVIVIAPYIPPDE